MPFAKWQLTDVTAKNNDGRTALHEAVSRWHEAADMAVDKSMAEAVVRLLLKKGADIAAVDCFGETALYHAAIGRHKVVTQLLLEYYKEYSIAIRGEDIDVTIKMLAS